MALSPVSNTDSLGEVYSFPNDSHARPSEENPSASTQETPKPSGIKDKITLGSSSESTGDVGYSPGNMKKKNTENDLEGLPEKPRVDEENSTDETEESGDPEDTSSKTENKDELTREEQTEVAKLRARDIEVKAHEQAHIAAGGQYVRGGASFDYKTGPDGEKYAVGGEVSIDVSTVPDNPEATIAKMQVVLRSALAPAEPSAQDRSVAASANRIASEARAKMMLNNPAFDRPADSGKEPRENDKNASADSPSGKGMKIDRFA